jgi:hypothetical protein
MSVATETTGTRTFRPRPGRGRITSWVIAAIAGVLLAMGLWAWTASAPLPMVLIPCGWSAVLLCLLVANYRCAPRMAVVVTPESITIVNGFWADDMYPFTRVRGITLNRDGHLCLALRYSCSTDLRLFIEPEDLVEFVELVESRALLKPVPDTSTAAESSAPRTFRPRPLRYRTAAQVGVVVAAALLAAAVATAWIAVEPQAGKAVAAALAIPVILILLAIFATSHWRHDRLAVTISDTEIRFDGRIGSKTIPLADIRNAIIGYQGDLQLIMNDGYTRWFPLFFYVEKEDREQFLALVKARAQG